MAEYTKEPFISELHLKKKNKTKLEREFILNWVTINKKKSRTQKKSIINKTKQKKTKRNFQNIEPENLLEPVTVNVFNLKKKKGGCRAKLNVFNLKKNER